MKKIILLFISIVSFMHSYGQNKECFADQLLCEYLVNPIGIDAIHPRFKWKINDQRQGALQQAYKITVGIDSSSVAKGFGSVWNPEKEESSTLLTPYQGKELLPFTKYFWAIQVWDKENKEGDISDVASFETGMLKMNNWKGSWISDSRDFNIKPAPYFRKEFANTKKIKKARVYVSAGGFYELFINGQRVGDHKLDPIYTRFDRRNLYVSYDVTHLLKDTNSIGVLLGNGWYNHQSTTVWYFHEAPWRARPRFCLDLKITYDDDSEETIVTDKSWKTSLSPVIFNSIYTAEHYDSRLEQLGWDAVGFDDNNWQSPIIVTSPSQNIVSQTMHPVRNIEEIPVKGFREINNQKYIFDLGSNIAGVTKISLSGEKGTTIRVTHSELLDKDGNIDQSNIDLHYRPKDDSDPFQTDIYTLNGNGLQTFSPRFNYKGFQYVEVVSDKPIELTSNSVKGIVMHSDVPSIGKIHSSNNTLNKIWEATNNSYLSNLFGYPTDCPQREKNGWTGDAHIAIETGLYNFDGITIYEKWMADHRDEQQPNGILPAIIPSNGWGYSWGNGPDWTSTIAIIPWNIYMFYGDSKILKDNYGNIKKYVDHITDISSLNLTNWGLGDWIPVKSVTPKEFTSSIYYYVDADILSKTAKILGKKSDFEKYFELAENIKRAINKKYFNAKTGIYGSGFQTELSAALYWGIVPKESRKLVADNLAKKVIADNKHVDVGLLGSKTILNALSENGYANLAYEVAAQEDYPSWGWWIANGANTLFENWNLENKKNDISHNHIMFGEISAWYYKALGGIKPNPARPGFKNILLEPHFVKGLNQFQAKFNGPYGEIISSWKRTKGKIIYKVTIPANSTASLRLSSKNITLKQKEFFFEEKEGISFLILESGTYTIDIKE